MKRILSWLLVLSLLIPLGAECGTSNFDQKQELLKSITYLEPKDIPHTPKGVHHYLLICMDKWQNALEAPSYNDGIVLLTFDEKTGRVIVTSFIRDMLVIHPDGNPGRLNRVVRKFGVQGLMDTINRHLGLEIEKYALMDWRHIMEVVDAVGGVDLELTASEVNYLMGWAVPENSTVPALVADQKGTYHLNGFASVIYMRIRKRRASNDTDTQDIGRTYRVRTVLSSLAHSLSGYDIKKTTDLVNRILEIWDRPYDPNFTYPGIRNNHLFISSPLPKDLRAKRSDTNITLSDIMEATKIAFSLRGNKVEQCRIPFDDTFRPFEYALSAGQLIDFEKNRQYLKDFMFPESFVVEEAPKL